MALNQLDSVSIDHAGGGTRTLMLCQGDITKMSSADAVDFICVSALPGDYLPTPGSVIGALNAAGVSVRQEAANKAANYEPAMPCWVSQDLSAKGLHFKRFILFEPADPKTNSGWDVTLIFRALNCFVGTQASSIAVPMVSTGSGGADFTVILRQLFYMAAHWGSLAAWPLQTIKLVVYSDSEAQQARTQFKSMKASYQNPPLNSTALPAALAAKLQAKYGLTAVDGLPSGMTQKQYNYVRAYTGSTYYAVNNALRTDSLTNASYIHWLPTIEAISSGLANLPNFSGLTQRGTNLPQSTINKYKVGAIIMHYGFTSTSRTHAWAGDCLLKITSVTGKDVEHISHFPSENEVLYDYHMTDKVTAVGGAWGGYKHVFTSTQYVPDWCGR